MKHNRLQIIVPLLATITAAPKRPCVPDLGLEVQRIEAVEKAVSSL